MNIGGIVGLTAALTAAQRKKSAEIRRLSALKKYFIGELSQLPNIHCNGSLTQSLPNSLNLSVAGHVSDVLVVGIDLQDIAVSAASACAAGSIEPSYVLRAMGLSQTRATSSIRVSWGWATAKSDLAALIKVLKNLV